MASAPPTIGNDDISPVSIVEEMKSSYLDYAMSVIVSRALPDVRDGLKPVHRRILFAGQEAGNVYNRPYRKSARLVGEVMGKYHPHGDSSIYDALARMTQDWSMRRVLAQASGQRQPRVRVRACTHARGEHGRAACGAPSRAFAQERSREPRRQGVVQPLSIIPARASVRLFPPKRFTSKGRDVAHCRAGAATPRGVLNDEDCFEAEPGHGAGPEPGHRRDGGGAG